MEQVYEYIKHLQELDLQMHRVIELRKALEPGYKFRTDYIYIFDSEIRYLYAGRYGAELLGFQPQELTGKHWREAGCLFGANPGFESQVREVLRSGAIISDTAEINRGAETWQYSYTLRPLRLEDSVKAVRVTARDITLEKRSEEIKIEIEELLIRYYHSLENMIDCFGIYRAAKDEQGHIVDLIIEYVNPSACYSLGRSKDDLIGACFLEILPGLRNSDVFKNYVKVLQTGAAFQSKAVICHDPIQQTFGNYDISAFRLQTDILGISWKNITKQVRLENELRKREYEYTRLIEDFPDIIARLDEDLRYIYVNSRYEKIMARPRSQVLGKTWQELNIPENFCGEWVPCFMQAKETGKSVLCKMEVCLPNGEAGRFQAQITPECNEHGSFISYLVVARDISQQYKMEKEMERLDRLNVIGEMAASIGHEVRNPLTAVRGFLQHFGMKPEYANDKEIFELIISELDQANHIITEFLSLAKNKTVRLVDADLNKVIAHLQPLLASDALRRGCRLEFRKAALPSIKLDESEIRQLLLNVVRNAFEAVDKEGHVVISTSEDDGVLLCIEDNGCGIPPDVMDKLGTPFFSTKDNGAGLGLAISLRIAQRHGAKLDFESTAKGTKVLIHFPVAEKPA